MVSRKFGQKIAYGMRICFVLLIKRKYARRLGVHLRHDKCSGKWWWS